MPAKHPEGLLGLPQVARALGRLAGAKSPGYPQNLLVRRRR